MLFSSIDEIGCKMRNLVCNSIVNCIFFNRWRCKGYWLVCWFFYFSILSFNRINGRLMFCGWNNNVTTLFDVVVYPYHQKCDKLVMAWSPYTISVSFKKDYIIVVVDFYFVCWCWLEVLSTTGHLFESFYLSSLPPHYYTISNTFSILH